jgi:hypothetical protein
VQVLSRYLPSTNQPQPAVYEQFFLFGDSITQASFDQERGFGFAAALQHGKCISKYFQLLQSDHGVSAAVSGHIACTSAP